MEKLNVRFSETQKLKIDDTAESLEMNSSDIARAAMYLGIQQLLALASADQSKAQELIAISNFRAK